MKKIGIGVIATIIIILIISLGMKFRHSASIGIIGGADGPTSVIVGEIK